jgi:hypothetical protein
VRRCAFAPCVTWKINKIWLQRDYAAPVERGNPDASAQYTSLSNMEKSQGHYGKNVGRRDDYVK